MKAIVIGAAKPGYAEGITRKLIQNDISVIGSYGVEYTENAKKMLAEFSEDKLKLYQLDLSSRDELYQFIKSVDYQIDGMIFTEFYFEMENPDQFDYTIWDKSIAINLTAPNYLVHELKYQMNKGSSIVIITSIEGFRGTYGASAYVASKAAIHNLVKTLANNLGKRGIRINALPAGWIGGDMDTDEIFNMSKKINPLGRLGTAEEIVNVAYFLFTKESSFVNGTTLVVDGGYLCSDPLSKYEFEDAFEDV